MCIDKLLTDNGACFTDRFQLRSRTPSGKHHFDVRCRALGIERWLCLLASADQLSGRTFQRAHRRDHRADPIAQRGRVAADPARRRYGRQNPHCPTGA